MNRSKQSSGFSTRGIVVLIVLIFSLVVFKTEPAADASQEIRIGGTGTALATMKLLGEQFRTKHPDITITTPPSLGSSGGIKALLEGKLDIAISYREPTGDEQSKGLKSIEYARSPFVFLTNKTNKVSDITLQKVIDIYSGKIITWPDETPIRLILRPAGESSTKILAGMSEDMNRAVQHSLTRIGLNIAVHDQENADLLERLPGSFGTGTLCQILSEKRDVNILSVNGVKPSVKTLADGSYPYYKDLYLITGPKSSPLARQFIDFVFSPSGRSILSRTGHLVNR